MQGARLFLQAAQDVNVGGRASRTQFQYTLQDANLDELSEWSPKVLAKLKSLPQLRDVASDQQTQGATLTITIDRDQASRYGITPQLVDDTLYDAFGQRQVTQYFTQLNSYHVILEILPQMQGQLESLDKIFIKAPVTGGMVPMSAVAHWTHDADPAAVDQPPGPVPGRDDELQPGAGLGARRRDRRRSTRPWAQIGLPPTVQTTFQGNAQAFQQSLGTVPLLILAALVVVYIILGVLYESFIHPLTILSTLPSAGAGALAMLMLFGYDFSLIALIGVILLIGIVKKNGIMLVDFAIVAERKEHLSPEEAIRKAALLRFRPILDDDHGGHAGRRAFDAGARHGVGDPPAARLRHGGRTGGQPVADAVHDPGDLHLPRQACAVARCRNRG